MEIKTSITAPHLVNASELGAYLKCSRATIYRLEKSNKIKWVSTGRTHLYNLDDVMVGLTK